MNAEPAALLSHFCVIKLLACHPRPFHVSWHCEAEKWERRIDCKKKKKALGSEKNWK